MNDTLVKCFLTIVQEGTFNKAAEKIYISQPNLSRNIAKLEEELGVKLFDRTRQRAVITEAGKVYQQAFEKVTEELRKAQEQIETICQKNAKKLRIGYPLGWNVSAFLQPIIQKMQREYPDMEITLEAGRLSELTEWIESDQVDLIITMEEMLSRSRYAQTTQSIELASAVLLYAKNHSVTNKKQVTPKDFKDEIFYVLEEHRGCYQEEQVKRLGKQYGFLPAIRYATSLDSILVNIENGLGVGIGNTWMRSTTDKSFSFLQLEEQHEVVLNWDSENDNRMLAAFLKKAKHNCEKVVPYAS